MDQIQTLLYVVSELHFPEHSLGSTKAEAIFVALPQTLLLELPVLYLALQLIQSPHYLLHLFPQPFILFLQVIYDFSRLIPGVTHLYFFAYQRVIGCLQHLLRQLQFILTSLFLCLHLIDRTLLVLNLNL